MPPQFLRVPCESAWKIRAAILKGRQSMVKLRRVPKSMDKERS